MKLIKNWLRFFRSVNLVMVAITMYLLRWVVLFPFFDRAGLGFWLAEWEFAFMVAATVLVTLGGYLINDYFDVEIDQINRPEKCYIGKLISKENTLKLYGLITALGGILSAIVAFTSAHLPWFLLYPSAVFLLWIYAKNLKRQPLLGNLLVSFFCGGVALLVAFSERFQLQELAGKDAIAYQLTMGLIWFYALFAFLSNLYREILKDLQDQEGDRKAGCHTVPIKWGVKPALWLAFSVGIILGSILLFFLVNWPSAPVYGIFWALLTILIPLIRNMRQLKVSSTPEEYQHASQRAKFIMLSGLLLLPLLVWESFL